MTEGNKDTSNKELDLLLALLLDLLEHGETERAIEHIKNALKQ